MSQRRPSHNILPPTHGLWNLWDMLNTWGYFHFYAGAGLAYAELDLIVHRRLKLGSSTIEVKDPAIEALDAHCDQIIQLSETQDLGPIAGNAALIKSKIAEARKPPARKLRTEIILDDVKRLKSDFSYVLAHRQFYYVRPDLVKYYGKPELFGAAIARKFKNARHDIERAGNCLALGEPTACVLHLNRVMEIAIHRLARRLGITPDAKDNMGSMLGKMTEPIRQLPDKTEAQKRKKEKWAECRTNLYHVKMAWRDPSSHGKQSYDDKEAADIFKRVQDFMQQLATL